MIKFDTWITISGYRVYLDERGRVNRGISADGQKPLYPYRRDRSGGYDLDQGMTPAAFRSGVTRGTVILT